MRARETERLILRPFEATDAEELHRVIYSDEEVLRWYHSTGTPQSLETVCQRLETSVRAWREDELGRLAVVLKATGELIGQVHLDPYVNRWYRWEEEPDPPFNSLEVELAFAFGKRWWGQSLAYEASVSMIRYAFDEMKLRRLVGGAGPENRRSVNLQKRLGYRIFPCVEGEGFVTILDNPVLKPFS